MPSTMVPGGRSTPELTAHLAVPPAVSTNPPPWPGVVVLHELFGLTDDIRQQADRLAGAGYLAVAPDLFSAGGARRCLRATFRALTSGQGPAVDDIHATRAWLAARPDCTGRVGVIGFCMGGGFALLTAAAGFDASAPSYGPLPRDAEQVLRGACPIVGSYGARDRALRGTAGRLEGVLDRVGVEHDVKDVRRRRPLLPEPAQPRAVRRAGEGRRYELRRAGGRGRLAPDPGVLRHPPAPPGGLTSPARGRPAPLRHPGRCPPGR